MQPVCDPYGQTGHTNGMRKRGDHAMLVTDSFDLHMLMAQYLLAVKSNKLLYLRSCQWHRFAFVYVLLLWLLKQ